MADLYVQKETLVKKAAELADVKMDADIQIQIEGFLRFAELRWQKKAAERENKVLSDN